jgi:PIN domain nuclease of toxin-antitoxin system
LTPEISWEANHLPGAFHRDPADRIIVASARVAGATLATQDRRIIEAGIVETI